MSQFEEESANHYLDEDTNIWYNADGRVVTTVHLTSDMEVKRDELFDHFSGYGEVQSVQIVNNQTHHSGFVTFTQAESVAQVLAAQCHSIPGHRTKVAIADVQPRALQLPIQLTDNSTDTKLLDLNDDCLLEILSLKSLTVIDLCSIARTSERLWDIANRIFPKRYKICNLRLLANTISEEKRTIVTFGSLISELSMNCLEKSDSDVTSVLDLVDRYCSGSLKSLRLFDFRITDCVASKLFPIFRCSRKVEIEKNSIRLSDFRITGVAEMLSQLFQNLQKLYKRNGSIDSKLFASCGSLVELYLDVSTYDSPGFSWTILQNTFPKLERFHYFSKTVDNLELFFLRHKNLKSIWINCDEDLSVTLPVIADNCKRLEEFAFSVTPQTDELKFSDAFMNLQRLNHLSTLRIYFSIRNSTQLIQTLTSFKSLKCLCLFHGNVEHMPALSHLKGLTTLKLVQCFGLQYLSLLGDLDQLTTLSIILYGNMDVDLVDIIESLVNLNTLELEEVELKFDTKLYLRIVDVVRSRSKKMFTIVLYDTQKTADDWQIDGYGSEIVEIKCIKQSMLSYRQIDLD